MTKPLNKRTPVFGELEKHLQRVSKEKAIPQEKWDSLKKAAGKEAREEK